MFVRVSFLLAISVLASFLAAQEQERENEPPAGEEGCLTGRTEDYLRRNGVIDPQTRLELTRELYESNVSLSRYEPAAIAGSTWTSVGPTNTAGRMSRIAVHPTSPGTFLAGAAGGGVWRTTNGGFTWTPLMDDLPNLNVGAVAYVPSNPSTIYVGTGEGDAGTTGIGMIWSTDGGTTWNFPSTVVAESFYAISVDPRNASAIVIATLNGAFRSTSGPNGPWTNVIPTSHVTDLERDPANPDVLYAARSPYVLKSVNGGVTWTQASAGLPVQGGNVFVDRLAIAIAPSSPSTLYCATTTADYNTNTFRARIYRTTNGGTTWIETNLSSSSDPGIYNYLQQTWYDNAIAVSPSDPNVVIAGGKQYVRTTDGGSTWSKVMFFGYPEYVHADVHDLVYDTGGTLYVANDGGVWTSTNNATTASPRNNGLVTRQYYKLAVDTTHPYRMYGGMQDNGTNERDQYGSMIWLDRNSGDGAGCAVSSTVPSYVISSTQGGWFARVRDVDSGYWDLRLTFPSPGTVKESSRFISELEVDPSDGGRIYTGTWRLWKTTTFGDAWSPLPTTMTDGNTWSPDSLIGSIAVSASNPNVLMVGQGYSTPNIQRSTDGGRTWRRAANPLPEYEQNSVTIDPHDELTAWIAFAVTSGAGVYMTSNGGTSWSLRSTGLPMFAPMVIRVDPADSNTIYCGTGVGLYRSDNKGITWSRVTGLPAVAVYDIRFHPNGSIRVATHGRGIWQLDAAGITNGPPVAAITSPAGDITVTRGQTVTFAGSVSDPDDGDSATGLWTFPDTWETRATPNGAGSLAHTFHTVGKFPVTLRARDQSGAMATSHVSVTVKEPADSCASAIVIPGAGPFPISTRFSVEGATATDDPDPIAACAPFTAFRTIRLSFTPAASGTYDFSVCGSDAGAGIVLYTGSECGPYTALANGCLMSSRPTRDCSADPLLSVSLTAGVPIRILATDYYEVGDWMSVTVSRGAIATAVTSVVPRAGDAAGGAEVVIGGSGFSAPATVSFGGTPATNVIVHSPALTTASAPPHAKGTVDVVITSTAGTATNLGGYVYTSTALDAPSNVVAAAGSASRIGVTWQAVTGADHYELLRRANGAYASLGVVYATTFNDDSATPGAAYLYKVRAIGLGGVTSADSLPDLATAMLFTDGVLVAGATSVKAIHLSELRSAMQAVRSLAGAPPAQFNGSASAGTQVSSQHVIELRTALNQARAALLLPAASYGNSAAPGTAVRAVDFVELRSAVQ